MGGATTAARTDAGRFSRGVWNSVLDVAEELAVREDKASPFSRGAGLPLWNRLVYGVEGVAAEVSVRGGCNDRDLEMRSEMGAFCRGAVVLLRSWVEEGVESVAAEVGLREACEDFDLEIRAAT